MPPPHPSFGTGSGSGPFGSMPFGSILGAEIQLTNARALTANEVLVCFLGDIGIPNGCDPYDPTYRRSWTLTPLDPEVCTRLVQLVEFRAPSCFVLYLDGPLCCGRRYRISNYPAVPTWSAVEFTALCVDPAAKPSDVRTDDGFLRDIANPMLERDAIMSGQYLALGTFEIDDTGDLAQDFGVKGLRKRILRRVTTVLAGFFHLPSYGTELEIKRLLKPDLLRRVQDKIRAQVMREPEVADCRVILQQVPRNPGVLSVIVRARTAAGQPVDVATTVNLP